MSTEKTYTVAGTSVKNGNKSWRVANGTPEARANVLLKDGHTDVQLQALPHPMTRENAIAFLEQNGIKAVDPTVKQPKQVGVLTKSDKARIAALPQDEEVDTVVEEAARALHATDWLKFMSWDEMKPETRNEFRALARNSMQLAA